MPRFENQGLTPPLYVEVIFDGSRIHMMTGAIGKRGKRIEKTFPSTGDAWREFETFVQQIKTKGFVEVSMTRPEAEDPPPGPLVIAASNPELEAAIDADPDRVDPYLVYADWLQAREDPRGELISLQHALEIAGGSDAVKGSEKALRSTAAHALLRRHPRHFFGPLLDGGDDEDDDPDTGLSELSGTRVEWRWGYFKTLRISSEQRYDVAAILEGVLAHPSSRFLRGLTLGVANGGGDNDYTGAVAAMVKRGSRLANLTSLVIGDVSREESEISWTYLRDLSRLWPLLPRLERLKLHGAEIVLGEVDLPSLRSFVCESGGLRLPAVRSIASAKWPNLESLEVWFGSPDYGAEGGPGDLEPILEGKDLRKLTHLGLRNAAFADSLVEALASSKILKQIRTLDLSLGCMAEQGAKALLKNRRAFAHLESLDLVDNCIPNELVDEVDAAGICKQVCFGEQQPERNDGENRYTAVGE